MKNCKLAMLGVIAVFAFTNLSNVYASSINRPGPVTSPVSRENLKIRDIISLSAKDLSRLAAKK